MAFPSKFTLVLASFLTLVAGCGESPTAPPAASAQAAPGSFAGVVRLEAEADPADFAALLIMGRRDPDAALPDMLVRLPASPLPRAFVLDARHMLAPGKVSGDWYLSARLDADGELLPARGDVEGSLGPVRPGSGGLSLALDTLVTRTVAATEIQLPGGHPPLDEPALPGNHPPLADTGASSAAPTDASAPAAPLAPEPAAHTQAMEQPPREDGPRLRGRLELADVHADRNGTGTLFLIVKSNRQARGMPRVAYRLDAPRFPLEFDLGAEHVPLQVENKADMLAGTLHLIARLDTDGNAMSKQPEDVVSEWLEVEFTEDPEPVSVTLDRSGP